MRRKSFLEGASGISRDQAAFDNYPGFDEPLARKEKSVQSCYGMLYISRKKKAAR